jgi:hypothetical protein
MKDENGRHVFLSNNYQKVFDVKFEDWKGKTDFELWPQEIAEEFRKNDLKVLAKGNTVEAIEMAFLPDGSQSWWLSSKFLFVDSRGRKYVGGLGVDITEHKKSEEQIKASLKEKEVLLREVHHRVKNNLQIISSLLDMSSMQTDNQETIDLFTDSRNRVNAMALIHTQLYGSERFDKIDMAEHVLELSKSLLQVYSMEKTIELNIKSVNIFLSINQAIPCALVLNELISNVCKHAYREGQKGTISIFMQKSGDDTILLRIKDDGSGIPEGFDIEEVKSLGLSLVRNLIYNQLKGKIDFRRNMGTEIRIDFKVAREKVKV